jgi:hypothetical protein
MSAAQVLVGETPGTSLVSAQFSSPSCGLTVLTNNSFVITVTHARVSVTAMNWWTAWQSGNTFRTQQEGTQWTRLEVTFSDGTQFPDAIQGTQTTWVSFAPHRMCPGHRGEEHRLPGHEAREEGGALRGRDALEGSRGLVPICELGLRWKFFDSRVWGPPEHIAVLVTSYFRYLASAPKVHWQAGAGAPALEQEP